MGCWWIHEVIPGCLIWYGCSMAMSLKEKKHERYLMSKMVSTCWYDESFFWNPKSMFYVRDCPMLLNKSFLIVPWIPYRGIHNTRKTGGDMYTLIVLLVGTNHGTYGALTHYWLQAFWTNNMSLSIFKNLSHIWYMESIWRWIDDEIEREAFSL